MRKLLLLCAVVTALASCSAHKHGYDYKHHQKRQELMYKDTKRVNKGKTPLQHQCTPKKRR